MATHEFEIREEIALAATPEQVWDAIATGPGLDSWFMGHSEIAPGKGGTNRLEMPGYTQESTITAWEPGRHLAFRGDDPDGTFAAFEFLIEGREGGSSVLRCVHNGLLGDDWEAQYDGIKVGDAMHLRKLAAYLAHFPGRTSKFNLFLIGPAVADAAKAWSTFADTLSVGEITEGARVRLDVPGLANLTGTVDFVSAPHCVGVHTPNGILMLLRGYLHALVVEYHGFSDDEDETKIETAYKSWLDTAFA
ncbi:SRPBCC domain-containing protein [Solihabitans fulvus]|uniref:SRPBCC domain-containing protein n=1 Tax=Solihabitans fulvus TaxID=1892852 RepID=A0A5B2X8S2_9PSEU|nr:SRPBCC domain-containing protein [Solihabitans fulvus]KAA2259521.1 SRPBCC domain-containing protein [Solihabitans fulvus]